MPCAPNTFPGPAGYELKYGHAHGGHEGSATLPYDPDFVQLALCRTDTGQTQPLTVVPGYPARIAAGGYFEAASFTADDAARGRSYVLNAERKAALSQATDMDGYLRGLEMSLQATRVGPAELPRSTQLINKTNQFNLTTRRYSEAQVERFASDPRCLARAFRLTDKFGDNGLIAVVLGRPDDALADDELLIDSWLMSCRVLGRQVEAATLEVLMQLAGRAGYRALIGEYRPTERNAMVAEHYPKLGFAQHPSPATADAEATFWRLDIDSATTPSHSIEIQIT